VYRVLFFHQRGAGRSQPSACLYENTTWHLVEDIERFRIHLGLEHWALVFGGSWGSTLALAYASRHPERVKALVVASIFGSRQKEMSWLYDSVGAAKLFPEAWDHFVRPIPAAERHDLLHAYYRRLTHNDPPDATFDNTTNNLKTTTNPTTTNQTTNQTNQPNQPDQTDQTDRTQSSKTNDQSEEDQRALLAGSWCAWESSVSSFDYDPKAMDCTFQDPRMVLDLKSILLPLARIECHYFVNGSFLAHDQQLIPHLEPPYLAESKEDHRTLVPQNSTRRIPTSLDHLAQIPGTIVQGRYDCCCPMRTAWELHKQWPKSDLVIVPDVGHMPNAAMRNAFVQACDKYRYI